MNDIDVIEESIFAGDCAVFDQSSIRFYLKAISKITHGFVGADLEALSKEAAMRSLRRVMPEIDFDQEKIPQEILQKIVKNRLKKNME